MYFPTDLVLAATSAGTNAHQLCQAIRADQRMMLVLCDPCCVMMYLCRKRYALKVLPAPEPSDVLWENLECTRWQRMGRRIVIAILNLVIIAIGKQDIE